MEKNELDQRHQQGRLETRLGRPAVPAMSALSATRPQRLLIEACLDNGVPFFWKGPGTLLIAQAGMSALLPAITAARASVIGFEGFEMESADIHPRLDLMFEAARRPDILNPVSVILDWPADI